MRLLTAIAILGVSPAVHATGLFCSQIETALQNGLPPIISTELSTVEHRAPHFVGAEDVTLWSVSRKPSARKLSILYSSRSHPRVDICGPVRRVCSDQGSGTYSVITEGALKGVLVYISSAGSPFEIAFMTKAYAMDDSQWGGECIEKKRGTF